MLIEFLGVALLLALLVIPLIPRKAKPKPVTELKVNTDTHDSGADTPPASLLRKEKTTTIKKLSN
jgi:hypothetical protein